MGNNPGKMRERIRILTESRKQLLAGQEEEIKSILKQDPEYPRTKTEADRRSIGAQIVELRRLLRLCIPHIEKIKSFVPKISDQTTEAACYLLFGESVRHFESVFLLAAEGLSLQTSNMIRAIAESVDLIVLFLVEGQTHTHLKKWFDGEIIPNRTAREAVHESLNQGRKDALPFKEMKADTYTALSSYSHMSYAAVLNSIDVFTRDFDWQRSAGFHYASDESLPYAKEVLRSMILALKQFHGVHLGDTRAFLELDEIYRDLN